MVKMVSLCRLISHTKEQECPAMFTLCPVTPPSSDGFNDEYDQAACYVIR